MPQLSVVIFLNLNIDGDSPHQFILHVNILHLNIDGKVHTTIGANWLHLEIGFALAVYPS